jgi:nitrate reductase delta subunit
VIFKLLSILLRYPDDEILENRAQISAAVHVLPDSPARTAALAFLAYWENEPASRLQASYIEAFDFKRRDCLYPRKAQATAPTNTTTYRRFPIRYTYG